MPLGQSKNPPAIAPVVFKNPRRDSAKSFIAFPTALSNRKQSAQIYFYPSLVFRPIAATSVFANSLGFTAPSRFGREQCAEALCKSRVSEDRIAKCGVRQPCNHGNLDRRHDLASVDGESGEAKDAVAIDFNKRL